MLVSLLPSVAFASGFILILHVTYKSDYGNGGGGGAAGVSPALFHLCINYILLAYYIKIFKHGLINVWMREWMNLFSTELPSLIFDFPSNSRTSSPTEQLALCIYCGLRCLWFFSMLVSLCSLIPFSCIHNTRSFSPSLTTLKMT